MRTNREQNTKMRDLMARSRRSLNPRVIAALATMVLVLVVFALSSRAYDKGWESSPVAGGFQNYQAEALAHGQLALRLEPPEGLLALDDPYDPAANAQFRGLGYHDLSLYDGRLYSYFGVVPVVLLHLPYYLITGSFMSAPLATFIFVSVGFVFLCLAWFEVARLLGIRMRVPGVVGSIATIGLGTGLPWILYIGRTYETAITAGVAVLAASVYFVLLTIRVGGRSRFLFAIAAGACFGALLGTRPQLAVASAMLVPATIFLYRRGSKGALPVIATLWCAFGVVLILVLAVNVVRFDSPFEFGNNFQLAGVHSPTYPGFQPGYLKDATYWYWIVPPRFIGSFPFVTLQLPSFVDVYTGYAHEGIVGTLPAMPFIPLGVALGGIVTVRAIKRRNFVPVATLGVAVLVAFAVFVIDGTAFRAATMRYQLDYLPLLGIVAMAGAFLFWQELERRRSRVVVATGLFAIAAYTVVVNVLLTQTPCQPFGVC